MVGFVVDVGERDFERDVIERSKEAPVVVDFWAAWCGPCRTLGPTLERLAQESGGAWTLAKVDVDANPRLARRYGIQGIPAVKAFAGGQVVDEFVGAKPAAAVASWLKGFVRDAAGQAVATARDALRAGDLDGAEALLEPVLAERPGHPEATALRDEIAGRREGAALDVDALRARVAANPKDVQARWDLHRALAARGDWEGALGELLAIVRTDRKFRDDGARKRMLEVFESLGARSPTSERWRGQLARVLF